MLLYVILVSMVRHFTRRQQLLDWKTRRAGPCILRLTVCRQHLNCNHVLPTPTVFVVPALIAMDHTRQTGWYQLYLVSASYNMMIKSETAVNRCWRPHQNPSIEDSSCFRSKKGRFLRHSHPIEPLKPQPSHTTTSADIGMTSTHQIFPYPTYKRDHAGFTVMSTPQP
jgi:hypothetical protein